MRINSLYAVSVSMMLILSACGLAQPQVTSGSIPTIIKETQIVEVTRIVEHTRTVQQTVIVPIMVTQLAPEPAVVLTEAPLLAPTKVPLTQQPSFSPMLELRTDSPLLVPRSQHTATILLDGRILVVGGCSSASVYLSDVEIFDPLSGISMMVAPLHTPRQAHTATLLPDGRVLVTGGYNPIQLWLEDSEVYDPATDEWTVIPMLATHGVGHTATLMQDGRVLVVGGSDASGMGTDRVEIFDPQTDSWWGAMPMGSDRASQTTQLLVDGRILVVGGGGVLGYQNIGDGLIYNPRTNTWSVTGPMSKPRLNGASVRLPDGRVLVAGGINLEDTVPGGAPLKMSNSAEIYNPDTNSWTATSDLNQGRYFHVMLVLRDGRVMLSGGARDYDNNWTDNSFVSEVELWDPNTGVWSIAYQLPKPGALSTGVVLDNGVVWLAGGKAGVAGSYFMADTWLITPKASGFTKLAELFIH